MMGLTELQRDMLEAIRELTVNGVAPSFIELKGHMRLASKSQVHRLLTQLEDRGCIRRLRCRARAIEVVPQDESIDRLVWSVPLADLPAMRAAIDRRMAP